MSQLARCTIQCINGINASSQGAARSAASKSIRLGPVCQQIIETNPTAKENDEYLAD